MTTAEAMIARSEAILKSWRNFNWPSAFSALIYPALGLALLAVVLAVGFALEGVTLHWWYAPLALAACAASVFVCNMGVGPLHRILQHRAGELTVPAQIIVAINVVIAMQGRMKDWVNYHSQHHRMADAPGDPHNPAEGKFWAWIGWLLWRDPADLMRPTARWLARVPVARWTDRLYIPLSLIVHFLVPAAVYALVWAFGGSLILTALVHAALVIGRALQFHATTLGVNVFGHIETPRWFTWTLALLTGGEALHVHHHDFPRSALHLPKRGIWNRIVDYNGTALLVLNRLRLVRNLHIAPQFA